MKKHIRTLSVVPLAALAVSVCALYPTKTEIFTQEPIDYKEAAVRLTAPSEPDTSAENITDPKSAVLDKVLNTIDRLDRVIHGSVAAALDRFRVDKPASNPPV